MQMVASGLRQGYTARLQTPYLNTAGACIQFFYRIESGADQPFITVLTVAEEGEETVVQTSQSQTQIGWNIFFATLPSGTYQIVIEGQRSYNGASGLAIDDVIVKQCTAFSK